jgi:hypothetical protein
MPGSAWLLPEEEELRLPAKYDSTASSDATSKDNVLARIADTINERQDEIFEATKAIYVSSADHVGQAEWAKLLESDEVRALFGDLVDEDPQQVLNIIKNIARPNT